MRGRHSSKATSAETTLLDSFAEMDGDNISNADTIASLERANHFITREVSVVSSSLAQAQEHLNAREEKISVATRALQAVGPDHLKNLRREKGQLEEHMTELATNMLLHRRGNSELSAKLGSTIDTLSAMEDALAGEIQLNVDGWLVAPMNAIG